MNKFLIFLLIFANTPIAFPEESKEPSHTKIIGSKELPAELNLLVESLANSIGQNKILPTIMNIDSYARVLSKEDIFLIGKVEIYKTLLKNNFRYPKALIDGNSTKLLKDGIEKANDPFVKWFLLALLQDCSALLGSSNFKDYILQKNNGRLETIGLKKIDKKVQLIFRWVSKLSPDSPDFEELLKVELLPVMMEALVNIEESFYLMALGTIHEPFPGLISSGNELKFFSLKESKIVKKPVVNDKTIDDILGPLIDGVKSTKSPLPAPAKEEWQDEDNAPTNLKNLPKPSDDADWLQDF